MKKNFTNASRNFSCGNESGRLLLGDNTGGGAVTLLAISTSSVLDFGF
jgi:hypothetical protein